MTDWVAVSVDLHDDDKVNAFAAALAVDYDHAAMRLIQLWGRLARHDNEAGDVREVADAMLEKWAGWSGAPGQFATEFRRRFTKDGVINGWWEWNGRHLRAARLERERAQARRKSSATKDDPPDRPPDGTGDNRGDRPPTRPGDSPPDSGGSSGPRGRSAVPSGGQLAGNTVTSTEPTDLPTSLSVHRELPPAVQLAIAANDGLRANSHLAGQFNELLPHQAEQWAADWVADGIPLDLSCATIRKVAAQFVPGVGRRQIHGFKYFDGAIRQAHAAASLTRPTASPAPEISGRRPIRRIG